MTEERLKQIIYNHVVFDVQAADRNYVYTVMTDVCGCSDDELRELGLELLLPDTDAED